MLLNQSYHPDFDALMERLQAKYPKKLFDMDGIGDQLDMAKFSKKFFSVKTTADASIDANANVDDMSVIAYSHETPKAFFRLNSYYMLWKQIRKSAGLEKANEVVERNLVGDIYINDFHGIGAGQAYSYHRHTTVIVKVPGNDVPQFLTMEDLFDLVKDRIQVLSDRETADLSGLDYEILDGDVFVPLTHALRHHPHNKLLEIETKDGRCTLVTEDHPVILSNGKEIPAAEIKIGDQLKSAADVSIPFSVQSDTEWERAYFLGFMAGDGLAILGSELTSAGIPRHGQLCLCQKDIENHPIYSIIESMYPGNVKKTRNDMVTFGSRDNALEYVKNYGRYSLNVHAPKDILSWNREAKIAYLCGLIDSEGTIRPTGSISIRVISYALVQQMATMLRGSGLVSDIRVSYRGISQSKTGHKSNHPLYSLSFRILAPEFQVFSEKVRNNPHALGPFQADGRWEGSAVYKIQEHLSAQEWVYDVTTGTGTFNCQGLTQHNCFNYSTYDLMVKGLPMIQKIKSIPPKFLYSFKSQLEQFTIIAANSTLGATGLADMLVVMSYYVKNALDTLSDAHFCFRDEASVWRYVKETLVSFIYTINQPMRGNQSCFTNISIYDKNFLEAMLPDYLFPDGTTPDIAIVQKLQDMFLSIMNEEMQRTPITFPVTTACFSVNDQHELMDRQFLNFIAEQNKRFGFINIYVGKSSTLSSCCFRGDQKVLTKSSNGGAVVTSIRDIWEPSNYEAYKRNLTIFHNGSWCKGKPIRVPAKPFHSVKTVNGKELLVTEDHLHPTLRGDVATTDLTTNDYLLFSTRPLDTFPEQDLGLSYEQGVLIGAYLGDGSIYKRKDCDSWSVSLSITSDKWKNLATPITAAMRQLGIDSEIHIHPSDEKLLPVVIYSKDLAAFIQSWVSGSYGYEKNLNLGCLLQSQAFRKGILDGFYFTDGGNSNRIYTTSQQLADSMEVLLTSLGLVSIIDLSDRRDEPMVVDGKEYARNFALYCVRWYEPKNKRSMGDIYRVINNSIYFRIASIQPADPIEEDPYAYCFDMGNDDEPYFTLPNGVITHNCRLRSNKESEYFNSFGSGSSKIGSLGVCTINLPKLHYQFKDMAQLEAELIHLTELCGLINHAKRQIIQKRIANGNQPLYTLGFMELKRQYSTVGINGFNEAIELAGLDPMSEAGIDYGLFLIDTINKANDRMAKHYKFPHNTEQIPGESVSIKLAAKDRLLGFQDQYTLYSNQFIPLTAKADLLDRMRLQGVYDGHFSGGAICHLNVETEIQDESQIANLIEAAAKMGVVYFAINYNLQECEDGHMSVGRKETCAICGKPIINNYTRVVGFLTNTKNWHQVRREQDYPNRQFYGGDQV